MDFINLDKTVQSAVNRAVAKAKFTTQAADYKCGDLRVHAYPLREGRVYWGVVTSDHRCVAMGTM